MTQYQATPDYYRDYIEHGWAKDAAAKVHKYIDRWKNAAGKWVYRYKKPESHPSYANWNTQRDWRAEGLYGDQNHRTEARGAVLTRYQDIQRAKQRAKLNAKNKKVRKGTGYSGSSSRRHKNLTSRGYSGSKGSGESKRQSNLGTRHSSRSLNNATGSRNGYRILYSRRAKDYSEYRKNPQRYTAKNAIEEKRILGSSDKYSSNKPYKYQRRSDHQSIMTGTVYNKDHMRFQDRTRTNRKLKKLKSTK